MNNENTKPGGPGETYEIQVNDNIYHFPEPKVTGQQILEKAKLVPIECYYLYRKLKGCDFEKISLEETVDLSDPGIERFITKEPEVFRYTVDGEPETTDRKTLTPAEILKLAGIDPQERYLIQVLPDGKHIEYAFQLEESITLKCPGLTFITAAWVKLVDIEQFGKECKDVSPAHQYRIRVDKNYHVVNNPSVTAAQLIALENKQPADRYDVFAFFSNQPKPQKLEPGKPFDLRQRCLLRFVLQPKEQRDGRGTRREFTPPETDIDYLNGLGLSWETIKTRGMWVIIYDYPLPEGYTIKVADLALMIPPNYPAVEIDMVYFYPQLQKISGRLIKAITPMSIDGRTFQRWSRHRQKGEWRPGIDDISTHLALVENWLIKDVKR
jgi:hypothetical protein